MILTTPYSKPIECTHEEDLLVQAYSILREVRHFFSQLEPHPEMAADLRTAARDFCLAYEQGLNAPRPQPAPEVGRDTARPYPPDSEDSPALLPGTAAPPVDNTLGDVPPALSGAAATSLSSPTSDLPT